MTDWPWPFEGVQEWFESLAGNIIDLVVELLNKAAEALWPLLEDIAKFVWDRLPEFIKTPIIWLSDLAGQAWTALWDFIRDPIGSIQEGLNWIVDSLGGTLTGISTAVGGVAAGVWTALPDWVREPLEFLKDLAGQAWTMLWDFVRDPIGSIQTGLDTVTSALSTAFDGALSTFGSWVTDAMTAVAGALGSAVQGAIDWLSTEIPKAVGVVAEFAQDYIVDPIVEAFQWVFDRLAGIVESLITTIEGLFAHHSPITSEDALQIGILAAVTVVGAGGLATGLLDVLSTKVIGTGLDLKSLAGYITQVINPGMFMGAVVGVLIGTGIRTPLTQYYNKLFRPRIPAIEEGQRMLWRGKITMDQFKDIVARSGFGDPYEDGFVELTKKLPGSGDLIRFVVREVIDTSVFIENMAYQGFSAFWADAYWEAHWVLPSAGYLVDAMHRGIIDRAEYDTFLVLHDYKPEPRPGIGKSDREIMSGLTKRLIPRVDVRRGYRIGRLSRAELDERYGWLGYEEDAELMADIQVGLAFEAERNKLRDNAKSDFVKGYILEDVLRADLAALGYSAEAIDFYVADALADRDRKHKDKLLDIYEDSYMKDLPTEPPFEEAVTSILVDAAAADLFIEAAYIRKYKKPKAAVAG